MVTKPWLWLLEIFPAEGEGTGGMDDEGAAPQDPPAVRLSEGRGQNNQQPTPNDNNKRVVVFLCGSGI